MRLLAVSLVIIGLAASSLSARPVKRWTEAELWKEADLVAIGAASSTKETVAAPAGERQPKDWVEVKTSFAITKVLQGKSGGDGIEVRHYRYHDAKSEITVVDGPAVIRFDGDKKHAYLMFLKLNRETSQLEPLTGHYDPADSFFRLEGYPSP